MSKFSSHKGGTAFSPMSQARAVFGAVRDTREWMHKQKQLCWNCQKDSVAEKGCKLIIRGGIKKYVCKPCMDAKREKLEAKEEDNKC